MTFPKLPRSALIKSFYWSNAFNKYKTLHTRLQVKNRLLATHSRYIQERGEISSKNRICKGLR